MITLFPNMILFSTFTNTYHIENINVRPVRNVSYSEEEREHHCIEAGHFHTHEIKLTPYCELYVNQLLKDAEYADSSWDRSCCRTTN
ncbi:hypothetical protein COOONC_08439 [Cooperia oncophora]